MKTNKLTLAAIVAIAGMTAFQSSAQAQIVSGGAANDDIILSFSLNSQSGNAYYVDLGNISTFTAPNTTISSVVNINSDLTTEYTSSWSTNSNLVWGLWGGDDNDPTSYLGLKIGSTPAALSFNSGSALTVNTTVDTLYGEGTSSSGLTAGSAASAADATGFLKQYFGAAGAYNGLGTSVGLEAVTGSPDQLELFTFDADSAPTEVGIFTLGSNGVVSFTNAVAAPEPSAYALGICGALLLLVLRRRHTVA